jgi:hypothetical protein
MGHKVFEDNIILDAIASIMSREEWDADTLDAIADAVRLSGRDIDDSGVPT